ncbi:MAG TPA: stage V sporulation protein AA [Candidatus Eisenbergiella merdigallinarum]|uniref:Stage V sporulation protein AA n=1 Tax=Candidatus Eisenbergiella merdigallinarum TaxID=2838552 RepID=A0A9D2MQ14_9FIRM|nr:stage V sporulation protein AA [Candidatus Eisenbergiella merdigallinarum]
MPKETLYLKLERCVQIPSCDVYLKDLGKLYCRDGALLARIRSRKVYTLKEEDGGRKVISVMYLIAMLQAEFPQLEVQTIGETEAVVKRVRVDRYPGALQALKICFVSGICFFGASFTIMTFHNDIGIVRVFGQIYEMITGRGSDGVTALEISYSIGLALGIIVFFNHIGGRRITKDPTPIEVEMRVYENDVNQALAETADREGKALDVDG